MFGVRSFSSLVPCWFGRQESWAKAWHPEPARISGPRGANTCFGGVGGGGGDTRHSPLA